MNEKSECLDIDDLVSMIEDKVEGMTISGEPCPSCQREDYYGHLKLVTVDGRPGIGIVTDCLWCGCSNGNVLK